MRTPFHRLLLGVAAAALAAAWVMPASARDGEAREVREPREAREARDTERELRDQERAQAHEIEERAKDEDDLLDRSGSDSGSDSDRDSDDDDDRSGSNSGRDGDDDDADDSRRGPDRRAARFDVERNSKSGDRQRDEVLMIGTRDTIDSVRQAGHRVLSERSLQSLRQVMVRIQVPDGGSVEQLVEALRALAPGAHVAPNHIFHPSQASPTLPVAPRPRESGAGHTAARAIEIGVIDTGADLEQPRLKGAIQASKGFAPGGYRPRAHGTAVAQLAALQGAGITIADVFGLDRRSQLVAPAELIAAAIDWMLSREVAVLNISIEGPHNAVLAFVIESAIARGAIIVAAAGNGGPAAAPVYPAAYPGVTAVTALNERGQVYRRAARGAHIQFAARGSYSTNQSLVDTREPLAGTSFAAPVVAAEIAHRWQLQPQKNREQILAALRSDALDLGSTGRDPIYGWGRVTPCDPSLRPDLHK
jgi:minor extracellular protease Epr